MATGRWRAGSPSPRWAGSRDKSATKPFDKRSIAVGITGTLGSDSTGPVYVPTLRALHRWNEVADTKTAQLTAHVDVLLDACTKGKEGPTFNSLRCVPFVGLNVDRDRGPADQGPFGTRAGAYAGLKIDWQLGAWLPRTSLGLRWSAYGDLHAPSGLARRHNRLLTLSASYELTDPAKKTGWRPAIELKPRGGIRPGQRQPRAPTRRPWG